MLKASVIVASAPGDDVPRCLTLLAGQAPGTPTFEVLIAPVAGGWSGNTPAGHFPVRVLSSEEEGIPAAWNVGAAEAQGDWLIFLRGDIQPFPTFVTRLLEAHAGGLPLVVVGAVDSADFRGEWSLRNCEGATLAVNRALFRTLGGFVSTLRWGATIEFVRRLLAQTIQFRRLEEPVARRDPLSRRQAAEARMAAGRGSAELYRRMPGLLPDLELGAFHDAGPAGVALRSRLLALGPGRLPDLEPLLPGGRWRERWRRFADDYHFWQGAMAQIPDPATRRSLARAPVILMYHAVCRPPERAGWYTVPERQFARQMAWLAARNYHVLSLRQLLDYRRAFRLPPPRSVVLTFDDGYADNHEVAYSILRAHGFPATFFLVSGCIGGRNTWDTSGELAGRAMLSWQAARELADGGMEIGGHTRRHRVLPELSPAELADEVSNGRRDLEEGVGRAVLTFAYPFGRLNDATTRAVADAGYAAACCSRSGFNDPGVPDLLLRRVEVRGTDSLWRFARAVHRGHRPSPRRRR